MMLHVRLIHLGRGRERCPLPAHQLRAPWQNNAWSFIACTALYRHWPTELLTPLQGGHFRRRRIPNQLRANRSTAGLAANRELVSLVTACHREFTVIRRGQSKTLRQNFVGRSECRPHDLCKARSLRYSKTVMPECQPMKSGSSAGSTRRLTITTMPRTHWGWPA
jgi:hypothetical protein